MKPECEENQDITDNMKYAPTLRNWFTRQKQILKTEKNSEFHRFAEFNDTFFGQVVTLTLHTADKARNPP